MLAPAIRLRFSDLTARSPNMADACDSRRRVYAFSLAAIECRRIQTNPRFRTKRCPRTTGSTAGRGARINIRVCARSGRALRPWRGQSPLFPLQLKSKTGGCVRNASNPGSHVAAVSRFALLIATLPISRLSVTPSPRLRSPSNPAPLNFLPIELSPGLRHP
jgi:hypothetical protein